MTGPGRYEPDPTEGITRVEELPKAKIIRRQRSFKRRKCPHCGHSAYRDKVFTRTLHDLGDLAANRPRDLVITYSQHCCSRCRKYFNADLSDLAAPHSLYTHRVVALSSGDTILISACLCARPTQRGEPKFSCAQGVPAVLSLPRRAAHAGKVTLRDRCVNVFPAAARCESMPDFSSFSPTG